MEYEKDEKTVVTTSGVKVAEMAASWGIATVVEKDD